jgi:hypothetical protein
MFSQALTLNHRGTDPMVDYVVRLSVGLGSTHGLTMPMTHIYLNK